MNTKIFRVLLVLAVAVMAWVGVAPAHAAPQMEISIGTWRTTGTGPKPGGIIHNFQIECENDPRFEDQDVLRCWGNYTAERTSLFYSLALYADVDVFDVPPGSRTFLWKDNDYEDNVQLYFDTEPNGNPDNCVGGDDSYGGGPETSRSCLTGNDPEDPIQMLIYLEASYSAKGMYSYDFEFFFSLEPISNCDSSFVTLTMDTYEIDPTIEFPQGTVGEETPIDEQIYPTVRYQYYKLYMTGGPWNDGTTQRDNDYVESSWDGVSWTGYWTLPVTCYEQTDTGEAVSVYIIQAQSETFHIRVRDTPGAFGNNYNDPDPVEYNIGIGVYVTESNCESQFSYGAEDWVASYQVHADSEGGLATDALEVGEWYAIEVANGYWLDEGTGPERTDMEYFNGTTIYHDPFYADLAAGSSGVWCESTDGYTVFIQADFPDLYLRVNNETGGFENNTGTLGVNIYHAAFTRAIGACETAYDVKTLVSTGTVNANQENGKTFAYSVGSSDMGISIGLEPGAWYYLETTGGSWAWQGSIHQDSAYSYDMAVSEDGDTWVSLEAWTRPECNVAIDALGHRGVYFQVPETAAIEWFLRVDDTALWFNNIGSMGWNLYGAARLDVDLTPGDACDFSWSDDPLFGDDQWVDATLEDGNPLYIYDGPSTSYYAIMIKGNDYHWLEQAGGANQYGMQISIDDGVNWHDFPSGYPGALCTITTGNQTVTFVRVSTGQLWRLRVDSSTFENNQLGMGYAIYAATPGNTLDPWTSCFDDATLFEINSGTFIPVKEEAGVYVNGTTILNGGNQIQLLQPTETYKLEIDQGPWTNGEGASSYSAAVSSDNGVTWYAIDDQSNPDIICGDTDFTNMHRSIYFTVQEGQKWKIRVNDTAGDFLDNGGNLAYKLYSAYGDEDIPPVDVLIPMPVVNNVCSQPLVRPASVLDVSGWVNYSRLAIQKYFAWCPQHTDMILAILNMIKAREPFATLAEGVTTTQSVKEEINSYNWTSDGEDFSILNKSPSESFEMFTDRAYAPIADNNPWETGVVDVNSFENFTMPDSYTTCQQYLSPQAGSKLAQGVCYASSLFLMTGASFWIQLLLDVGIGILIVKTFFNEVKKAVAMATGVPTMNVTVDSAVNIAKEIQRGRTR